MSLFAHNCTGSRQVEDSREMERLAYNGSYVLMKELPKPPSHLRVGHWLSQRGRQIVRAWWAWEIMSVAVSVLATVLLLATLAQADSSKSESQVWTIGSTELTLNTLVAAIGTVQRASLLLAVSGALNQHMWNWFASPRGLDGGEDSQSLKDLETIGEGSANLWSCLKVLCRTRGRYIVSIGALITILAIAFDAFLQQLVSSGYQPQRRPLSGDNFTSKNILPYTFQIPYEFNGDIVFSNFGTKISAGAIQDDSALPTADCPTTECTWPITTTLGMCSECAAVDALVETTGNSSCESIKTYVLPPLMPDEPPKNWFVQFWHCGERVARVWKLDFDMTSDYSNSSGPSVGSFYVFGAPFNTRRDPFDTSFVAYKCKFSFCVKGYSASSLQGRITSKLSEERIHDLRWQRQNHTNATQEDAGFRLDMPSLSPESPPIRLNVSWEATQEIIVKLLTTFVGIQQVEFIVYNTTDYTSDTESSGFSDSWAASGSLANLTTYMDGVAEALTTWMRTTFPTGTGSPDPRLAPVVTTQVLIVHVRWAWLAYPLTLQIGGLIFLALTMYQTSHRNVRPWKGHRIPLLLARLDDSIQTRASGGLANRTGLDDRVGEVRVRLDFDGEDRMVFRRVQKNI